MCAESLPVSEGPAAESLQVKGNIVGQELERGKTIKARVLRLVHRAHPAAQFLDDAVVGEDGLADREVAMVGATPGQVNESEWVWR